MDIGGILSKIEGNANKLGLLAGGYAQLASYGTRGVGSDFISAAMTIGNGIVHKPHIPNLSNVLVALTGSEAPQFMTAIQAAVLGYILKEININPQLSRLGNALQQGGTAAAEAVAAITLLAYSGIYNSPLDTSLVLGGKPSISENLGSRGYGGY